MDHERHRRIRWTKRLLRPLPRRASMHRYPVLGRFADVARKRPYLWSFRVGEMTPAFYVGSILALSPAYGVQIPIAFVLALVLRANLPAFVALQFITNPLTIGIYVGTGWVGKTILEWSGWVAPGTMGGKAEFYVAAAAVGGLVCGLVLGATLDLVYRFLAYEARKHHWHIPRRKPRSAESASPGIDADRET